MRLPLLAQQLIFLPKRVVVFLLLRSSHFLLCLLALVLDLLVVEFEDLDVGESHDVRELIVLIQSSFLQKLVQDLQQALPFLFAHVFSLNDALGVSIVDLEDQRG